jgi:maltooligosyltrehalose trehalohydrolase
MRSASAARSLKDAIAGASPRRRLPVGAEPVEPNRTHFRLWAPSAQRVDVVFDDSRSTPLDPETVPAAPGSHPASDGYFSGIAEAGPGATYHFRLDGGERLYPDPASRFQPEGPHGPSEIVDPRAFEWSDVAWPGVILERQVMYELHVGTFTRPGTWAAAEAELAELARLGITVVEIMPVADFPGRFGWGYDGVNLFAPTRLYGRPDDFRRFVDRAHALGLGVLLDVVYNHLGPSGNYLRAFSPAYFTDRYANEWGEALNFDGPDAAPVREFFLANAGYWIDEYHLDGLRLDATHQILDGSPEHILAAIATRARDAARPRSIVIAAENDRQESHLVRPAGDGGFGLDAVWNDDFHHSAMVALTGRAEGYYGDTRGEPQELISAAKHGYLFQGQYHHWHRQPRGSPAWGISPASFVVFLQNHDQVANSARGLRGHQLTSPGRWRAMTALLLLMPATPLLFQGQEFAASAPFLYFADVGPELAESVRKGRAEFLTQFPSLADYEARGLVDPPSDPATFERCKLDVRDRDRHGPIYALHRDLLRLRRDETAFRDQARGALDGAVLSSAAFVLRFFDRTRSMALDAHHAAPGHHGAAPGEHAGDRLLIVNLGPDLRRASFAEPLLAPPPDREWDIIWSSEDPRYGGMGTPALWQQEDRKDGGWSMPGESAIVLSPSRTRSRPSGAPIRRTA